MFHKYKVFSYQNTKAMSPWTLFFQFSSSSGCMNKEGYLGGLYAHSWDEATFLLFWKLPSIHTTKLGSFGQWFYTWGPNHCGQIHANLSVGVKDIAVLARSPDICSIIQYASTALDNGRLKRRGCSRSMNNIKAWVDRSKDPGSSHEWNLTHLWSTTWKDQRVEWIQRGIQSKCKALKTDRTALP